MLESKMPEAKSTKLSLREDRPTAISSSAHGSNLDGVGFNIAFIAVRNPKLAVEILELYALAAKINETDPEAPDEDFSLFADKVANIIKEKTDN